MQTYKKLYESWTAQESLPEELKSELLAILEVDKEIEERFHTRLTFGTGGMRGLLGAGTNRVNLFTIRLASDGLARYIKKLGNSAKEQGVVIAYDTRHYSRDFALQTAKVLGNYGIHTFVFNESRPTPELSFAVRKLGAIAGVVITASHNPAAYNGFKVYGEDGGQLTPKAVKDIVHHMDLVNDLFQIKITEEKKLMSDGLLTYVQEEIDEEYQQALWTLRSQANVNRDNLSIVYTPLHGAGLVPIAEVFKRHGFTNVEIVPEQAIQNPQFPTVVYPNPEEREAFEMAIALGKRKAADILLATDPDADRLGVAVRKQCGNYELLTGNQLGALLLHYILVQKSLSNTLPENAVVLKTIVTSELGRAIGKKYGITVMDTLTGFKFISERIEEFEQNGEHSFLFGYEESYGYLIGDFVRDKDAVQAALVTVEMAAYYKMQGKTLQEALVDLFEEFGYFQEALESITLSGMSGQVKIEQIMYSFRENPPKLLAGIAVEWVEDYEKGIRIHRNGAWEKLELPKADVLKIILEDNSWVCIRPSGTEPKCKFYIGVCNSTEQKANHLLDKLKTSLLELVQL